MCCFEQYGFKEEMQRAIRNRARACTNVNKYPTSYRESLIMVNGIATTHKFYIDHDRQISKNDYIITESKMLN